MDIFERHVVIFGIIFFDVRMKFVRTLLNRFNGLHYRQEYLCLALEKFPNPLRLYTARDGKLLDEITRHHHFVGYCPVIFALPRAYGEADRLHLVFSQNDLTKNEVFQKKDVLAELFLEKIFENKINGGVFFYQAVHARHRFLPSFNQFIIGLNNILFNKKEGNVFLKGNLLKQVQVAYSMPRKICLISTGKNGLYNLFPTDLHGKVNDQLYVISLRHEGKACRQVMETGRLVLSDMEVGAYKRVYSLGKNHMQPLKERYTFEFSPSDSAIFHLPLPLQVLAYKELELADSFTEGIHRLLIFRIVNEIKLTADHGTLAHIHSAYATWRENNGLKGNYLLR